MCDFTGQKGVVIRNKPTFASFAIDDMNAQLVEKCGDKSLQDLWQEQQAKYKSWQGSFRFPSEIEVNDKVDVRSLDFVWCVGTVKLIIEQVNKDPLLVIHKDGFSNEWDELLYRNSPRVAVAGAFTNRNDIPKYVFEESELLDDPDPESTDQAEDSERSRPKIVNNIVAVKNPDLAEAGKELAREPEKFKATEDNDGQFNIEEYFS